MCVTFWNCSNVSTRFFSYVKQEKMKWLELFVTKCWRVLWTHLISLYWGLQPFNTCCSLLDKVGDNWFSSNEINYGLWICENKIFRLKSADIQRNLCAEFIGHTIKLFKYMPITLINLFMTKNIYIYMTRTLKLFSDDRIEQQITEPHFIP